MAVNNQVNMRMVSLSYLVRAIPSFAATGANILRTAINNESFVKFDTSTLAISAPTALASGKNYNTSIVLTPIGLAPYSGSHTFRYRRTDMLRYFADVSWKLNITAATTLYAQIAAINTAYGCNFVQGDLVDQAIPAGRTYLVIVAAATSYLFLPGSILNLGAIPPQLQTAFTSDSLSGF